MKVLIVSGEYPPMKGGVGRYTYNLISALNKKKEIESLWIVTNNIVEKSVNNINLNEVKIYGIIRKGDMKNSDRLLTLTEKLKPDIVHIQYETGLYETTTISHYIKRIMYGSTLDKFYKLSPVPTITTLHTIFPYEEYQYYINERALRKEGRLGFLPTPLRVPLRRWLMKRRYEMLLQTINLSNEIINLAEVTYNVVKRGTIIYHGAEPAFLLQTDKISSDSIDTKLNTSIVRNDKEEFRKQFGLPIDRMLLLAFGYAGWYKGFDILEKLKLPDGWSIVIKQTRHERGVEKPLKLKESEFMISLDLDYSDDITLSKLMYACDAIIFPYRIVSISGVLFDALAHGLPFVASDLEFFKEFARMGFGITSKRTPDDLTNALSILATNYEKFKRNVEEFAPKLRWDLVAEEHIMFYREVIKRSKQC